VAGQTGWGVEIVVPAPISKHSGYHHVHYPDVGAQGCVYSALQAFGHVWADFWASDGDRRRELLLAQDLVVGEAFLDSKFGECAADDVVAADAADAIVAALKV